MTSVTEIWSAIPNHDGWEASNLGRIRSVDKSVLVQAKDGRKPCRMFFKGRVLVGRVNGSGYRYVNLTNNTSYNVHRIVAETFLGPRPTGCVINHIDGDKQNNSLTNLEYTTVLENNLHAMRLGLIHRHGENSPRAKATEKGILTAVKLVRCGMQRKSAAALTNTPIQTLHRVLQGRSWKHLRVVQ